MEDRKPEKLHSCCPVCTWPHEDKKEEVEKSRGLSQRQMDPVAEVEESHQHLSRMSVSAMHLIHQSDRGWNMSMHQVHRLCWML